MIKMKFSLAKLFDDVHGSRVVTRTNCKRKLFLVLSLKSFDIVVEVFWTLALKLI